MTNKSFSTVFTKLLLFFIIAITMTVPLKGIHISIGIHGQFGKTMLYKWDYIDYQVENLGKWNPTFSGYFGQLLFHLKKIHLGVEYGRSRFYSYEGFTKRSPGWTQTFTSTYEAQRVLFLGGFPVKKFWIQVGAGIHIGEPEFTLGEKKKLYSAVMVSGSFPFKITSFLTLPVSVRLDYHGMYGKPIALSLSTGLVFRWKSGL